MLRIEDFISRTEDLVSTLKRLVEVESPTQNKEAVDQVGALVRAELNRLGAQITEDRQTTVGDHIVGRWNRESEQKGILLLCHMDTVHPIGSLERNPCIERDEKLFGPGSLDMKAGIAILLVTIKALQETKHWPEYPIRALFTSDEETGSLTSRNLIEQLARESALALCLEPCLPGGELKTWRKGVGDFEIIIRGRAAHAGAEHNQGRNAIEELAHQVLAIQRLTDYEKGTTLNVGIVQGGTASNVVPAEARAQVDFRVMRPDQAGELLKKIQSLKPVLEGTSIEISGGLNRPPMPRDDTMIAAFKQAQKIGEKIGLNLEEAGTGGGSDANFIAPLGVPVLDGLGGQGNGQHSDREYVLIRSLVERSALLAGLLTDWQFQ